MTAKLYYQGHGSFRITTGKGTVIYLDPFAGDGYGEEADLILVTHQHGDHNRIDLPARKEGTCVLQNFDMLKDGVYQTRTVRDVTVRAVPACNKNHRREACVGYLISFDTLTVYAAGDTSTTVEMADLRKEKVDYAFFPIDGVYNMDAAEASACARTVGARHSVPIHVKPGALYDLEAAKAFSAPGRILIGPGDTLALVPPAL